MIECMIYFEPTSYQLIGICFSVVYSFTAAVDLFDEATDLNIKIIIIKNIIAVN